MLNLSRWKINFPLPVLQKILSFSLPVMSISLVSALAECYVTRRILNIIAVYCRRRARACYQAFDCLVVVLRITPGCLERGSAMSSICPCEP